MRAIIQFLRAVIIALTGVSAAWAADGVAPQLSISTRGPGNQTLEQGEPWRVAIRLNVPRGSKETVKLAPASGAWTEAVSIEMVPAAGGTAVARAEAVGKADAAGATLDAKQVAGGLWRFSPTTMQAVPPGNYLVRATLSISGSSGWNGTAQSRSVLLKVVALAAKPPVRRLVNEAHDRMLTGRLEEAAKEIDVALRATPRDAALLTVRAQIAEQAGNPFAATMCLNAANFSTAPKKSRGQPSAEEMDMQARLEKARRAMVVGNAKPPEWTWPPQEVLTALSAAAEQSGFIPKGVSEGNAAPAAPALVPSVTPVPPQPTPGPSTSATTPAPASVPMPVELPAGVLVPAAELDEAKILADKNGRWASTATAGSQYSSPNYAAAQATGAPNVPIAGDSTLAWCPARQGGGTEWLEVGFATPLQATEVRVRQTNLPGAIVRIDVIDTAGRSHPWWAGEDPQKPAANQITWLAVRVPAKTDYAVAKIRITLNLDARPGWKQVDAVQLVGTAL